MDDPRIGREGICHHCMAEGVKVEGVDRSKAKGRQLWHRPSAGALRCGPVLLTRKVLIMLTVPEDWAKLEPKEVARKLRANPGLVDGLAEEVVRWGRTDAVDLTALRTLLEEREAL